MGLPGGATPTWRKSSRSGPNANCVEVSLGRVVGVRDSKDPSGPVLAFDRAQWTAFVHAVRTGHFDRH